MELGEDFRGLIIVSPTTNLQKYCMKRQDGRMMALEVQFSIFSSSIEIYFEKLIKPS
jgi:hypothetical protein